jgi:hypothetical protein
MANTFVRRLITEQRRRLVGSLMRHIEIEIYPHLPQGKQRELREKVLASVGAYHDVVLDVVTASVDDNSVVNEKLLEAIEAMHRDVRALGD